MGSPDLKVIADGMIKASMGMVTTVMPGTRDTAIALFHELDRQHAMAGDDEAGQAFAEVQVRGIDDARQDRLQRLRDRRDRQGADAQRP
jgi:hypothetical protein